MTPEGKIVEHIVKTAGAYNALVRKVNWSGRRGAPDRFIMMPRVSFWLEVKAPGKHLEPHQFREIRRMMKAGNFVKVVSSIEEVDAAFKLYHEISEKLCEELGDYKWQEHFFRVLTNG